ncbi:uncharacterized protein [Miscanthus floridulus]|uniref:uncharacterized protein n=1 Tax=Miscanthus floridulus TaxID=154761 RepID=UPI00345B08C0
MEAYCVVVRKLEDKFDGIELHHVLRWDNKEANSMVRLASSWKPPPSRVFLDIHNAPSVHLKEVNTHGWCSTKPLAGALPDPLACLAKRKSQELATPIRADDSLPTKAPEATLGYVTNAPPMGLESVHQDLRSTLNEASNQLPRTSEDYRAPFLDFLEWGILLDDIANAHKLIQQDKSYEVLNGQLYQQSASKVLLWCVTLKEGRELLLDMNGGICAHHVGTCTLMGKAFRHGFYWPTALANA